MSRTLVLSLFAGLAMMTQAQAQTQSDRTEKVVVVKYGDLDLSSKIDARIMLGRITAAASASCSPMPTLRDLTAMADFNQCRRKATISAVRATRSPVLAAISGFGQQTQQLAEK